MEFYSELTFASIMSGMLSKNLPASTENKAFSFASLLCLNESANKFHSSTVEHSKDHCEAQVPADELTVSCLKRDSW